MLVRFVTGHAFLKWHNKIAERGAKIGEETEDKTVDFVAATLNGKHPII